MQYLYARMVYSFRRSTAFHYTAVCMVLKYIDSSQAQTKEVTLAVVKFLSNIVACHTAVQS